MAVARQLAEALRLTETSRPPNLAPARSPDPVR
jgi:hypothetical protein